jgi:tetratricopeptide (TPR) repeat protein
MHQLEGEAHLARRRWADAVAPLARAVGLARAEDDEQALARCLSGLGRAHYRQGAFADAEPLLREAVNHTPESTPERASAVRALADIELRQGRITQAEDLLNQALDTAVDHTWRDAEARARRGLAHVRTVQGRYSDAIQLLMQADDQLSQDGDPFVRAGVMSMLGELEAASGRLGSALWRTEALVEHARRHGMSDRLPEAYALLSDVLSFVADPEATDAARQALVFANASGGSCWSARLQAARNLHRAGADDAETQLPDLESVPDDPIRDPAAQLAALRARVRATADPKGARDLAAWALGRPAPVVRWFGARVALDASIALRTLGHDDDARDAAKRGLALVKGTGADALRVELMVALFQAREDTRVIDALGKLLPRIVRGLPPNASDTFRDRPVIRDVLG